jgi:hypothetical protein
MKSLVAPLIAVTALVLPLSLRAREVDEAEVKRPSAEAALAKIAQLTLLSLKT